MKVLVTRPIEDAEKTAGEVESRGHGAVIAPLMKILFRIGPDIAMDNVQAVLATSANGVRALAMRTARRDIPVYAVGPQTAEAARNVGFQIVKHANGDSGALVEAVAKWARPQLGTLLHASGVKTKGDVARQLAAVGFSVRTEPLYEAIAVETLPSTACKALASGEIDAVLVYSPRSAEIFAACTVRAGFANVCKKIDALCISRAAANALAPLQFHAVRVAERPNEDDLLALLE